MKKYNSTSLHFSSLTPLKIGSQICTNLLPIKVWELSQDQTFEKIAEFKTTKEFETKMGSVNDWIHTSLITDIDLTKFYKDGPSFFKNSFYIVTPTQEYKNCKTPKPDLIDNYLIKDRYNSIIERLPELNGIF